MKSKPTSKERSCRFCGCTETKACHGGCVWLDRAKGDVCSACVHNLFFPRAGQGPLPDFSEILAELHTYVAAEFDGHSINGRLADPRAIHSIRCLTSTIELLTR